ncbi:hypothetical protein [Mycobacterium ostraviense]|nr:hypothetical protein [Mycobacterium ostraviense]UGT91170.1 hypothetical protein LTS72_23690 [Mycobacterium ostraviense]
MTDSDLAADHLATVQHVYEAFGTGDVAAILDGARRRCAQGTLDHSV